MFGVDDRRLFAHRGPKPRQYLPSPRRETKPKNLSKPAKNLVSPDSKRSSKKVNHSILTPENRDAKSSKKFEQVETQTVSDSALEPQFTFDQLVLAASIAVQNAQKQFQPGVSSLAQENQVSAENSKIGKGSLHIPSAPDPRFIRPSLSPNGNDYSCEISTLFVGLPVWWHISGSTPEHDSKRSCALLRKQKQNNAIYIPSARTQATVFALEPVRQKINRVVHHRSVISPQPYNSSSASRSEHPSLNDEVKQAPTLSKPNLHSSSSLAESNDNLSVILATIASAVSALAAQRGIGTSSVSCACPCQQVSSTHAPNRNSTLNADQAQGRQTQNVIRRLVDGPFLDSRQADVNPVIAPAISSNSPSIPRLNLNFRSDSVIDFESNDRLPKPLSLDLRDREHLVESSTASDLLTDSQNSVPRSSQNQQDESNSILEPCHNFDEAVSEQSAGRMHNRGWVQQFDMSTSTSTKSKSTLFKQSNLSEEKSVRLFFNYKQFDCLNTRRANEDLVIQSKLNEVRSYSYGVLL